MNTAEINLLQQRASEVQAWHRMHPDGPADARSPEISPGVVPADQLWKAWMETDYSRHCMDSMLAVVAARRRDLLGPAALSPTDASGRWAIYDLDTSDYCQLAACETDGLFDNGDCPGWDLWVACLTETKRSPHGSHSLLVWVPDRLVARFNQGMRVMPMSPVVWADDPEVGGSDAVRALREAGLF